MSGAKGVLSENGLMQKLVQAKKVMNKVDGGNFERGHVNETVLRSAPEEIDTNTLPKAPEVNQTKIMNSKLPDAIKKAMIENPIPQISLNDSLDMDFVKNTKKLMEAEGVNVGKQTQTKRPVVSEVVSSDMMLTLTPLIENIVRKTVSEIMDSKLNQILTAQQTLSINENLVLKVGDSIFKGKITGVSSSNKSK